MNKRILILLLALAVITIALVGGVMWHSFSLASPEVGVMWHNSIVAPAQLDVAVMWHKAVAAPAEVDVAVMWRSAAFAC